MENELKSKIEEKYAEDMRVKDETINQLKQDNEEKAQAILNSQTTMQDTRITISKWQEKVGEKKKLLEEAKEAIKSREIQIACLKEQSQLLTENSKVNADINKVKEEKMKIK